MATSAQAPRVALVTDGHRVVEGDIADGAPEEAALAVHLDVTDSDSVDAAVTRAERELGPIEILVNTAGCDCEQCVPRPDRDAAARRDDRRRRGQPPR